MSGIRMGHYLLTGTWVQSCGIACRWTTDRLFGKIVGLAAPGDLFRPYQRVGEGPALPGYLKHVPESL